MKDSSMSLNYEWMWPLFLRPLYLIPAGNSDRFSAVDDAS